MPAPTPLSAAPVNLGDRRRKNHLKVVRTLNMGWLGGVAKKLHLGSDSGRPAHQGDVEARRSLLTIARTVDEATGIVRPFADPLLEQTAAWEPTTGRWSGEPGLRRSTSWGGASE
jgi:hypothetical protein